MTSRAQELAKMLGRTSVSQPTTFTNRSSYTNTNTYTGEGRSWWSYAYGLGITILVVFILLLVVHYTVKPIFPKNVWPWAKNLPFVSPQSESQLVWTDKPSPSATSAGFQKLLPNGFTLSQDILVKASTAVGKVTRVFSYRSAQAVSLDMYPQIEDLITTYPQTNLFMYLAPDTNDLTVSVVTGTDGNYKLESAPTILNVPVGQPFRVTVVLFMNLLEVYFNGKLFGTKTLISMPKVTISDFYGPPEGIRDTIQTMNLQYWDRPLDSKEIMNISPPLPSSSLFGPLALAGCATTIASSISENVNASLTNLQQNLEELTQ